MGETLVFGRRRAENEYVGIMDRRSPRVEKTSAFCNEAGRAKKPERKEYFVAQSMLEGSIYPVHTEVELFLRRH